MISIDRLKSLKSEVSSLFVLKRCGHAKLESKILSEDLLDFVNKEAEENDRTFFAFNKLTHWEIVAIIDECETEYKQVEKLACDKLLATLPEELRGTYESLLYGRDAEELHDIVKAADKLSAYIKCIEERKAGNNEFISAEKQTRAILDASPLPEVKYFLDKFIPAFELTLDELGTIDEEGKA